ncbi:MAG: hypothetical protein O2894_06925 [Planctomycetota bacterium]|nr:hypothetical protein [Planctomycetota bacterium]
MFSVLALLCACLGTAVATPLLRRGAARWGLVDVPGERSTHRTPVARIGGLAVVVGIGVGLFGAWVSSHVALDALVPWLLPAAAFLAIGLWDDRCRLSARVKFLLQALAAAGAVAGGLRWEGAALAPFGALEFGVATPFMTWLWILAVVTLINLMDGLDLITATTCAVMLGAMAGAGAGPWDGAVAAVGLGAVLGFVPWNMAPARAFLGDAGTHLLGFFVACAALQGPASGSALPWVLASAPLLPGVLDLAGGLIGKARRGVPLSQAHRQHLSQRLARASGSHARAALRYGALACVGLALGGLVAPHWGLIPCLLLAGVVVLLHLLQGLRATRDQPVEYGA